MFKNVLLRKNFWFSCLTIILFRHSLFLSCWIGVIPKCSFSAARNSSNCSRLRGRVLSQIGFFLQFSLDQLRPKDLKPKARKFVVKFGISRQIHEKKIISCKNYLLLNQFGHGGHTSPIFKIALKINFISISAWRKTSLKY